MTLKAPPVLVNHSARKAWESYLSSERNRLLPEFPNSFGSKLLDPCEITDNDVRLEFRFVQQPIGSQDKNATSCTPWRMCQMLAAKDESESEVEMDSDAFNLVTSDDYGRNLRGETLKQVGDSLQHRCPLLGLHHRTALRTTRVRCRIRTALVPMERPEKWRTEVRCVFRHAPTCDASRRLAFLLASELGIALDLGRRRVLLLPVAAFSFGLALGTLVLARFTLLCTLLLLASALAFAFTFPALLAALLILACAEIK